MIDTANLSRSLVYHTNDILRELGDLIDRGERIEFAVNLLKGMIGENLPLYLTRDIPSYHELIGMKGLLREKALRLFEAKVPRLFSLYLERPDHQKEIYYLLARHIAETDCSFKFHLQFVAITLQNLEDRVLEQLSCQASCRHDIHSLAKRCYGTFDCEGRTPYPEFFRKIIRKLNSPHKTEKDLAHAYLLLTDLAPAKTGVEPGGADERILDVLRKAIEPLPLKNPEGIFAYLKAHAERPGLNLRQESSVSKPITQDQSITKEIKG